MTLLDRTRAEALLSEAQVLNPGPWVDHSRQVAECTRNIAAAVQLDVERAGVFGLLHDVGRRYGVSDGRHTLDGYRYLQQLGDAGCARICLTHSLPVQDVRCYSGHWDVSAEDLEWLRSYLIDVQYDDYDRLIQLCDSLALPGGPVLMEKRLVDVVLRHGWNEFTLPKWRAFMNIRADFDQRAGRSIYDFLPGVIENTFKPF